MPKMIGHMGRRLMLNLHKGVRGYLHITHRFVRGIRSAGDAIHLLSLMASVVILAAFVIYMGYDHSDAELVILRRVIRGAQTVFLVNIFFGLLFGRGARRYGSGRLNTIVKTAVLITLLPLLYPRPDHPWIGWLDALLYSRRFIYPILCAYALVDVSEGVMKLVERRTNPSLLLSGSFIVVIFIGSLLLMLPRCTYGPISYVDALFVSTSAVCITGLTPVDVFTTFTPLGIVVLALLIQIGGLGVMTFTSFFALFFSGRTSIYSQLMLKDMIYSKSMSTLLPTLLYILAFTLVLELAGAVAIFFSVRSSLGMSTAQTALFAMFHSLSSFCNAGFSTLPGGMSNPLLLYGNISIYWVTSVIVILGAIGFPILVNFKEAIAIHFRRAWSHITGRIYSEPRNVHPYNMNTKIVLVTFTALFVAGTVSFLILEWDNSLAGMTLTGKVTQAVFNSVTPRSAGFSSVNPAGFLDVTLVIVMFLMWVGGASQSTAGGIKVNTFAAICLNLRCIVTGREKITAFRRTIAVWSVRRANAVVAISLMSYLVYSVTIMALEPGMGARTLLFETLSALFTVGSSLGATPELSAASKLVLCSAMFLGRVGIISLMSGLAGRRHDSPASFPTDNLIIN